MVKVFLKADATAADKAAFRAQALAHVSIMIDSVLNNGGTAEMSWKEGYRPILNGHFMVVDYEYTGESMWMLKVYRSAPPEPLVVQSPAAG